MAALIRFIRLISRSLITAATPTSINRQSRIGTFPALRPRWLPLLHTGEDQAIANGTIVPRLLDELLGLKRRPPPPCFWCNCMQQNVENVETATCCNLQVVQFVARGCNLLHGHENTSPPLRHPTFEKGPGAHETLGTGRYGPGLPSPVSTLKGTLRFASKVYSPASLSIEPQERRTDFPLPLGNRLRSTNRAPI